MLASVLRERMMAGELTGEALTQEDLVAEFRVSRPSVREALRILETEGLVIVRRGSAGGAIVQRPTVDAIAWTLGLVLQARQVSVADVARTVCMIEPACAAMCARRSDRAEVVVPALRGHVVQARAVVHDGVAFARAARQWDDAIVERCGNRTMQLVAGAITALWTAHSTDWAAEAEAQARFPSLEHRHAGVHGMERITDAIERGDATAAATGLSKHLVVSTRFIDTGPGHLVNVTHQRTGYTADRQGNPRI